MSNVRRVHEHAINGVTLYHFARLLGEACLDHNAEIRQALDDPLAAELIEEISKRVAAVDPLLWRDPGPAGGFVAIIDGAGGGLTALLEDAEAWGALPHCAVLRGLCAVALHDAFIAEDEEVVLDRGSVIPYRVRPVSAALGKPTPHPSTSTLLQPLYPHPFDLFARSSGDVARVILDFRHRDRLDEIMGQEGRELPRIGTYHPSLRRSDLSMTTTETSFFDVAPKHFVLAQLDEELRAARSDGADVVVAPELSRPARSDLAARLAAEPSAYPPIVIAGSAHVRQSSSGPEVRSNACEVYIDGQPAMVHHKIHPFQLPGRHRKLMEDLTGEPKALRVLCGSDTRLAVAICSDLNDKVIPYLLADAWVNMLFVPALTTDIGAFNGALALLASTCQAFGIIVNGAVDSPPFHVMAAVPVPQPGTQVQTYFAPGHPPDARGTFDPNVPTMTWR
jgi:hypothetical protein